MWLFISCSPLPLIVAGWGHPQLERRGRICDTWVVPSVTLSPLPLYALLQASRKGGGAQVYCKRQRDIILCTVYKQVL